MTARVPPAERPVKLPIRRLRPADMLFLIDALTALLLLWYFMPVAKQVGRSIFFAGAFGLWLVLAFCADRRWLSPLRKALPFLAAWFVIYIGNYLMGRSAMFFEYLLVMSVFFAPVFLYTFYEHTGQADKLRFFAVLSIVLLTVTAVTTLIGQLRFPNAARLISTGVKEYGVEDFSWMNIGNYGVAYGLMLLIIVLSGHVRRRARGVARLALAALIVFYLLVMYKMEFTTSLLLVVAGMAAALGLNGRRAAMAGIALAVFVLLAAAFSQFGGGLGGAVSDMIGSETIRERVEQLFSLFQGNVYGDLAYRGDYYMVSIRSVIANPLFGVGGYYGYDIASRGIGGHAELFDITARYGIIGLISMLCFFIAWFRELNGRLKGNPVIGSVRVMQGALLALASINVIFIASEIGAIVFFTVPALAYLRSPTAMLACAAPVEAGFPSGGVKT